MKKLFKKIKEWYHVIKAERELSNAVDKALELYRIHNKRYYVIPDTHHRLRVFSWSELKAMKKQGLFSAKCKEPDFIRESFYFTPSRITNDLLSKQAEEKKKKAWIVYYKAYRM